MPELDVNSTDPQSRPPRRPNGAEAKVGRALRDQLQPGEVLLEGVRFSDPRHGDVEVDFLVLFPDAGVAVIEVKGGTVSLADGQWLTQGNGRSRRIDPIRQARGAKHSLRRYLDRQAEWSHGLVRSEWFIALPDTPVTGDMGPEARRELLIGSGDMEDMRDRLRTALMSSLNTDRIPPDGWVDDAVSLLLRGDPSSTGCEVSGPVPGSRVPGARATGSFVEGRATRWVSASVIVLAAAALSLGASILGGWKGLLALTALLGIAGAMARRSKTPIQRMANWRAAVASGAGLALGVVLAVGVYGPNVAQGQCHRGYLPCIPITDTLDCSDIRQAVRVVGADDYGLDRDGDGVGCESYS